MPPSFRSAVAGHSVPRIGSRAHSGSRVVIAALVGAIVAGCKFAPQYASGEIACGRAESCPTGLTCRNGRCCASADKSCGPSPDRGNGAESPHGGTGGSPASEGDGEARPSTPADASPDFAAGDDGAPVEDRPLEAIRMLPITARLTHRWSSCTRGPNPGEVEVKDRWCVLTRGTELWVLNVTEARAGQTSCTGADPACLRLTERLMFESMEDRTRPTFGLGDLLIFSAERLPGPALLGVFYAWAPGWPKAVPLTPSTGYQCRIDGPVPAVWCLDGPTAPNQADIRAGVPSASQEGPLPVVVKAAAFPFTRLSSDGSFLTFLYGTPPERHLHFAPLASATDPLQHRVLLRSVAAWAVDGRSAVVLVLPDIDPLRKLTLVDLVDPTQTRVLAEKVSSFRRVLDRNGGEDLGFGVTQDERDGVGQLQLFLSRPRPATITLGRAGGYAVSPDTHYTLLHRIVDPATKRGDLRLVDNRTGAECTLQRSPQVAPLVEDMFSSDGAYARWVEYQEGGRVEGWITSVADCQRKWRFSPSMTYSEFARDGILFVERDEQQRLRVRFLKLNSNGAGPSGNPRTWEGVPWTLNLMMPAGRGAVVTSEAPGAEGIYFIDLPQ